MLDIPSRHRPLVLLAGVVLSQILLLAIQIRRDRNVRLIRIWSVELLTPLQRGGTLLIDGIANTWRDYVDLRHTREENERLRAQLNRLELRNQRLEGRSAEAQRLAVLLGFREEHPDVPMVPAEVIGASADPTSHAVYIDRGERDGLRRNLPVITPEGIVGKIAEAFPHTAQVLLITDRESGVGALLANSRAHGVVKGTGEPQPEMDYVVNEEKVAPGEVILTSGEDRIFPKDLPIGTVARTKPGYPFQTIRVEPATSLDRLEEVLVLLTQEELTPVQSSALAPAQKSHPASTGAAAKPSSERRATAKPAGEPPAAKASAAPHAASKPAVEPPPAATKAQPSIKKPSAAPPKPAEKPNPPSPSAPETKPPAQPKPPGANRGPQR